MPEEGTCPFPLFSQHCQQGCRKVPRCWQHLELRVLVGAEWSLLNWPFVPLPYRAPEAAWLLTLLWVSLLSPSPKVGSHGLRDAGIQQGSPSTEVQQEQQTIGCTATQHQSQHLFSIFFIQRKGMGITPAEQCLPATALP